mmetsp:Transcript_11891/g.22272  ORF Transcript_11891/g.22272 Transcript_11891/m.22272 type:complete len:95 (-) Transcript_11891:42-326(-)
MIAATNAKKNAAIRKKIARTKKLAKKSVKKSANTKKNAATTVKKNAAPTRTQLLQIAPQLRKLLLKVRQKEMLMQVQKKTVLMKKHQTKAKNKD